jgi:hypothetical protein
MMRRGQHAADHPEGMIPRALCLSKVMIRSRAKDGAMSNGERSSSGPQFQAAPLITSAIMVGAGTFIVMAGLAVGGSHLVAATRRWVAEMEVPPSELARIKWTQARAAMSAGAQAWQNGTQAVPAGSTDS